LLFFSLLSLLVFPSLDLSLLVTGNPCPVSAPRTAVPEYTALQELQVYPKVCCGCGSPGT
jgi:hypothetical protein